MVRFPALALCVAVTLSGVAHADPSVVEVHKKIREIESARLRGRVDEVRLGLQQQARSKPGDILLRVYIAWCDVPSDEAWNALKGVATIHPDHPWARLGMGRIYSKWNVKDKAEAEFKHALKTNPRFYPAMVGLAELLRTSGKTDEAIAKYREALAVQDDAEAHGGLGLALLEKNDAAGAKQELERAVTLWVDQPRVLTELARLARDEKDLSKAADWTEKLVELTPKDPNARKQLGDLRFDGGNKAGAAKDYERAIRLGFVDKELYRRLTEIYRETNDAGGEQRALEQLVSLEKQSPEHPARLAELAEARADLEGAEAQLLEAVDRAPTRGDLLAKLGSIRVKRESFRDALEAYRAARGATENKPAEIDAEIAALQDRFKLPKKPLSGSVDKINGSVSASLNEFYKQQLKKAPELGGELELRVRVDAGGNVQGVEVLRDSVEDPWLAGHAYFALKDAVFPKSKKDAAYRFSFELNPPKGKK